MLCQMCSANLDALNPHERQEHYNRCLDNPCQYFVSKAKTLALAFVTAFIDSSLPGCSFFLWRTRFDIFNIRTEWLSTEVVLVGET